jgi:hypothetical protein
MKGTRRAVAAVLPTSGRATDGAGEIKQRRPFADRNNDPLLPQTSEGPRASCSARRIAEARRSFEWPFSNYPRGRVGGGFGATVDEKPDRLPWIR